MWRDLSLSLTGSATLAGVSLLQAMAEPMVSLVVGVGLMVSLVLLSRQMRAPDGWSHVFRLFSWTANLDLMLVLGIANILPHADFYLEGAEPYFRSGHGFAINLWDATFHWSILLYLLQQPSAFSQPWAGALWAGSTLNSMPVFLIAGIFAKPFAGHWSSAIFLNVPFLFFPLIYALRLLKRPTKGLHRWNRSIWWVVFGALIFHLHRFGAALDVWDTQYLESSYLEHELLFGALQAGMHCFWIVLVLLAPSYNVNLVWLWIGATLQGQFAYIIGSFYHPERYPIFPGLTVPPQNINTFFVINVTILVIPWVVLAAHRGRNK